MKKSICLFSLLLILFSFHLVKANDASAIVVGVEPLFTTEGEHFGIGPFVQLDIISLGPIIMAGRGNLDFIFPEDHLTLTFGGVLTFGYPILDLIRPYAGIGLDFWFIDDTFKTLDKMALPIVLGIDYRPSLVVFWNRIPIGRY